MLFWRTFQMVMVLSGWNVSKHEDSCNFTFLETYFIRWCLANTATTLLKLRAVTNMAPLGNHLAFPRPIVFYIAAPAKACTKNGGVATPHVKKLALESSNCLSLFAYLSTRANKDQTNVT